MPFFVHAKLAAQAAKLGLHGARAKAYIYGPLNRIKAAEKVGHVKEAAGLMRRRRKK